MWILQAMVNCDYVNLYQEVCSVSKFTIIGPVYNPVTEDVVNQNFIFMLLWRCKFLLLFFQN